MSGAVTYAVTPWAYQVQVWRNAPSGAELVEEYMAGNSSLESQAYLDPKSPTALEIDEMRRMALQTAGEMAEKHDIDTYDISYDADEEVNLTSAFGPESGWVSDFAAHALAT